ncbi:MAG: hypothetical protein L6Q33_05105 [Bacteriovoracaceae bacterium]|jgi:hypothetical protein|nr:hypothetical protein [Bacteriovoracaceae bacterium]
MSLETENLNVENLPKAPRNFRNSIEIENFYRFIHENDLRKEARIMLELIQSKVMSTVKKKRNSKDSKKKNLH